jgi:hypothetical protein
MTSIELTSISGISPPYVVYACDIYGAVCTPIATVASFVPPTNTIILPPSFAFAPAVGIKIVGSGCEHFEVFFCDNLFPFHVCFEWRVYSSPSVYESTFLNFTQNENINGKPSWITTFLGIDITLYWDSTQWVIVPTFGLTNPNEDLFFGLWYDDGTNYYYLLNSYCPSICIILFDGVNNINYFLQFYSNSGTPFYEYDDGIDVITVSWDSMNNLWELTVNSVLTATFSLVGEDETPIGTWVLEPSVPYVDITTVLECPEDFKQFQNTEYFYFMDGIQYNFQN